MSKQRALRPLLAIASYVAVVAGLMVVAFASFSDIGERRHSIDLSTETLARLEGRRPGSPASPDSPQGAVPTGSPFLEGRTVTVAGAALLQRVAGAVTRVGGNVLSSQVELQGSQSKDGYVNLIASCEIEPSALQQLLYDLEAGMPFLFVEQLVAQAPVGPSEGGRMRVVLGVSGLWPGAK